MADQYINPTGLQAIKTWITSKFATADDLDTLSDRVDDIVSEGGEPNVINTVKVNGSALTPDANKAVDVTVPTTVAELTDASDYALAADIPADLSDLTNTGQDPYATEGYVDQNGGKIDVIKVNGTAQTISNKEVDITGPTAVSDLSDASDYALAADIPSDVSDLVNDAGYQTASDVSTAIAAATTSVYRYKGTVATKSALPNNAENGDVYDVQSNGVNYAWNGSSWDALGGEFDATAFWQKTELTAMTVSEINAILEPSS